MTYRTNVSDESALRKKVLEIHAHDGSSFDTESLLASIEGILNLVMPGVDATTDERDPNQVDKLNRIIAPSGHDSILDTLPYLLHKITCVLNCTCLGGDDHASAIEILQLLANYTWQAKILIVLASFIVEYAQYSLVSVLYKSIPLAKLVAILKQIPDDSDEISNVMKSKFENIINQVKFAIEVTSIISKFGCLPSKYISNDSEPMVDALTQIPLAVYWMTRVVIACSSVHSEILGKTEVRSSYTETNITTIEKRIATIHTTLKTQLNVCNSYIEEKKQIKYVEKLKVMFHHSTIHQDNQKILQAIINNKKDGPRPLSCGPDVTTTLGVEALKGKDVLLLVSDLEISSDEITKISQFYKESRTEAKYEIVWLPIVENIQQTEVFEEKYQKLKCTMPWYALEKPNLLKSGFVKYVKEEWRYSKKSIMVSLDQRGKVVHQNAFHMMWTWGNSVSPFTHKREFDLWKRKEWSLKLLVEHVEETREQISTWMSEDKVICLYGGDDYKWIQEFVETTKQVVTTAEIKLEMVYVCKKNTRQEHITRVKEILNGHGLVWENTTSAYFWKRIECMMYSKVHHGAKVAPVKQQTGDHILAEVLNMLSLGDSDTGWALISQGPGSGPGKMARAKGDVIHKALLEYEKWSVEVKQKGFTVALHDYIAGRPTTEHHCNRLILPGIEDIPGEVVCAECHRPMEKYIMYRCCTD